MIIALAVDNEETRQAIWDKIGQAPKSQSLLELGDADYFFLGGKLVSVADFRPVYEDWKQYTSGPHAMVVEGLTPEFMNTVLDK